MRRTPTVAAEVKERSKEDERAFRDEVNLKAADPDVTLADFDEDEKVTLSLLNDVGGVSGLERLNQLRRGAYAQKVSEMKVPDQLQRWARGMGAKHGPQVKVWSHTLPWLEALAVLRFGEEPSVWPDSFDADDVQTATKWALKGRVPLGASYIVEGFSGLGPKGKILAMLAFFAGAVWIGHWEVVIFATALSNFWENELIDHLFRARSYTAPTNHFFALFTAAPGETGGGTEVTGGSYARVDVAAGFANFEGTNGETTNVDSAGTGGATQNRNAITFPTPSANWGSVTHFGDFDASSSGNLYTYGALTTPKTVNNGDPAPSFAAGAFDFALA